MNRLLLTAAFLLGINSVHAQTKKYLIIDRKLKQTLQHSDTISNEQLNKGFFAVEQKNINQFVSTVDSLRKRLRSAARETYDQTTLNIGITKLIIKVTKLTAGDRLNVAVSTDTGNGYNKEFDIASSKLTNNDNARYLARLIKYIQQG